MFKMNLKKALALLASVLMLCSLVPVGALLAANASDNNLVVNGDFEDGSNGWNMSSYASIVNTAHAGSGALKLENPSAWGEAATQIVNVDSNSEYKVVWYSKRVSGTGAFDLFIMNNNGYANLDREGPNWMNETSGNWVKNECVVKTGTATQVMLKFSCEAANAGVILVDDLVMTKLSGGSGDQPEDGPVLDMDFEDDVIGFNGGSIVTDGSKCLKWTATGAWSSTQIVVSNVKRNTDYVVTFKAKGSVAGGMGTTLQDANWGPFWNGPSFNVTTQWQKFTIEFNTANYPTADGKMFFKFQDVGVAMDLYVDDLKMVEKGSSGDQPGGDEPDQPTNATIANGDFETGDGTGWELWQNTVISADAAHDGAYGAHLKGSGSWGGMLNQSITVTPGSSYEITFWVKTNANGVNLQIKDGTASGANLAGDWFGKDTCSDWTEKKYIVAPTTATIYLNLCGAGNGVAEDAYVDSFSITELKEASFDGYITNGDFETGKTDSWENLWGSCNVEIVGGRNGGSALKLSCNQYQLFRQIVNVEPNTDYVVYAYSKDAVNMALIAKTCPADQNITGANVAFAGGSSWSKTTLEFNSGDTNQIYLALMGSENGASGIFDDFSMYKKGEEPGGGDDPIDPPPSTDSAFQNGDFETGDLTGWQPWQSTEISADAKKNGSYGAKLVGDGGWGGLLDQTFSVEAGKTYTLSFWYKANAGGANFVVKQDGVSIASHWGNMTDWAQITLEFTPTTNSLLLNICGGGDNIPAEVYVDDFVLAAKPTVQMGVLNGNFEDGTNGWILNADSKLETSDVHAGSGALYVSAAGQYAEAAYQVMGLEPNTDYTLTWYAKRVSGGGAYCVFLMNENGLANMQGVEGQTWMNETSGEWVKYEVTFNSGSVTEMRMKWGPETANAGAVLIDDIVLQKAGEEPVDPTASLIKNGSFENGKDDWSWGGESEVIEGDYYEGAHSAKLVNNSAWGVGVEQYVKVEKNTDYVIRFYTKRVTGNGVWMFSLMDGDTVNVTNENIEVTSGQKWFSHTTTNKWVEHVLEFNSGDVTKVLVKLGPEGDNAGSYLLDYFGMWVKGNEPSPDNPDDPVVPPKAQTYMTSYGVLNNRPINQDDNLLENPSFEKSGGQWKTGFKGDTISVVKDSTTLFGNKSLFFNTAGIEEETKLIFWVDVKADTSYVFSTWLKGAYLADDNRGLATIGVVDENGKFLSMYQENDITRFLNGERQIVPTAWDDEWHLRGIEFNTGEYTKIGIALAGKNSQMWIDDMALFEVGQGKKYMSANAAGTVSLSYTIDSYACNDKDSLIPDPTFSKGTINDFWKTSYGWRNGFLSLVDNKYEYGTSLKYTASGDNAPLSIIKTIEVEPNTDYTFAVDVKILEDGWGKLMLCDGKIREPISFLEVSFDSYDYDEESGYYGWYTTVCKFNTDVYDSISLVIVDDGGQALLDNMRLYKSDKGTESNDKFIVPPEEPTPDDDTSSDDDWYGDDWYDEPIIEEPVIDDQPIIEEPDNFDDPVDEPEPVPTDPVAPVVNDEGSDAWIWIAIGGGVALLAGAGVFLFFFLKKKKTTPPTDAPAA